VAPSYADDERFRSWWRRLEVYSATPAAAAGLLRWAVTFDPAPILPAIQVPTLVLERAVTYHDQESRWLAAAQIPNARYVLLPGADALPYLGDADAILDEVEEFLTGARGTAVSDRSLATVLFTDIAGSTDTARRLGDRRWGYLLEDHHAHVRRLLKRFRGMEVDTAGDGFFATFDGPARAIRCACAIRDAVADLGIEIRAGLHTGEVGAQGRGGHRPGGPRGGPGRRARRRQRGAGHQHRADARPRLRHRLRRPGEPQAQGSSRPVAPVRGGTHLTSPATSTPRVRDGERLPGVDMRPTRA
jgi:hypothetical protein